MKQQLLHKCIDSHDDIIDIVFNEFIDYMYIQYYKCNIELYVQIRHHIINQYEKLIDDYCEHQYNKNFDNDILNDHTIYEIIDHDFNEISLKIRAYDFILKNNDIDVHESYKKYFNMKSYIHYMKSYINDDYNDKFNVIHDLIDDIIYIYL